MRHTTLKAYLLAPQGHQRRAGRAGGGMVSGGSAVLSGMSVACAAAPDAAGEATGAAGTTEAGMEALGWGAPAALAGSALALNS